MDKSLKLFCSTCEQWANYENFKVVNCGCVLHAPCIATWLIIDGWSKCPDCDNYFEAEQTMAFKLPRWKVEGSDKNKREPCNAFHEQHEKDEQEQKEQREKPTEACFEWGILFPATDNQRTEEQPMSQLWDDWFPPVGAGRPTPEEILLPLDVVMESGRTTFISL